MSIRAAAIAFCWVVGSAVCLTSAPSLAGPPSQGEGEGAAQVGPVEGADKGSTGNQAFQATRAESEPQARRAKIYEDDPLAVQEFVLDNGLTVLISENHTLPEVFGAVGVRTGGANDPADNTGMAHYLEHMLFKGTTSLGTSNWVAEAPLQARLVDLYEELGAAPDEATRARVQAEISKTVEQTYAYVIPQEMDVMLGEIGGTGVNAFTDNDETVYHNTFPASQIETWLKIYAHRFTNPVFRLFPTELEAVYEEKNISIDRFENSLYEAFVEQAWPEHPYGQQQVLGEIEHLKRPSLKAMRAYFDRYYVPSNMVLALSGDVDAHEVMPMIEATFGTWVAGDEPEPRGGTVEPFDGAQRFTVRMTPLRAGAIGYRTPAYKDPDYPALLLTRELLYNEQGSGFLDQLSDRGKLLLAIPFPLDNAHHGLELVFFAPRILFQTFSGAEKAVHGAYQAVAAGAFSEAQLESARQGLLLERDRAYEDNEARALAMVASFTKSSGWATHLDQRKALESLTKRDIMEFAARTFGDDRLHMRSRLGKPNKTFLKKPATPAVKPQRGVHSEFYSRVMDGASVEPKFEPIDPEDVSRAQLASGVVLTTSDNPHNDLFQFDIEFGVGTDAIPELDVAAPYLARLAPEGRTVEDFKQTLRDLGVTFWIAANEQRFWIRIEGPNRNLEEALGLAQDLLDAPQLDRRRFRQLKRERAATEKVTRQDPRELATAVREFALYGENSGYLRAYGPGEMARLGPKHALAAVERARGYAVQYRYVGTRDLAQVEQTVRAELEIREGLRPAVDFVHYDRVLPDEPTVFFSPKRGAVQTQVFFAVDGDSVPRELHPIADAYSDFMGNGMSGLAFQEVREFRALAYSTFASLYRDRNESQDAYLIAYVGCQADKTEEAIEVMLQLITEFPAREDNLESVRRSLLTSLETQAPTFRQMQERLESWRRQGYNADPRSEWRARFETFSFADVQSLFEAQIKGRPVTLVVVGDPRRVSKQLLERFGTVRRVRPGQVFSR